MNKKLIIALAIFSLIIYGCGKRQDYSTLADQVAYENLQKIDQQLADVMYDDVSSEDSYLTKIVPIAEHVSIQKTLREMLWSDVDDGVNKQVEILVLDNVNNVDEKLLIIYSKETKTTHLFLIRNANGAVYIAAHTVLSLSVSTSSHKCYVNSDMNFVSVDSAKNVSPCPVPSSLIDRTVVLRKILKEKMPAAHTASELEQALRTPVKIFEAEENKRLFLMEEDGFYSLLSGSTRKHTPKSSFIGFFESGYGQ